MFEQEFRKPSDISQAEAARRMGMSTNRLNEIVAGKRSVTAETAVPMGALSNTDPRVWLTCRPTTISGTRCGRRTHLEFRVRPAIEGK